MRAIEESNEPFAGSLIQDHPVAETVRTGPGVAAGRLREHVPESFGGCLVVWVRRWWLGA
jgi:hypothetical protein